MRNPTKILTLAFLSLAFTMIARPGDSTKIKAFYHEVNYFVEDNEGCLKCHGEANFILEDELNERSAVKRMGPTKIIDRDNYYTSVHKSFGCTDCHSFDFMTFPHSLETRFEEAPLCMDCHGYDETFAQYHFEGIEVEFTESTHNREGITCWKLP